MPMETPQGTSADGLPQRDALLPRLQVPDGRFQTAARHVVAANVGQQRIDVGGAGQLAAQHARDGVIAQQGPRGASPLLVVEGVLAGGDFTPAGDAIALGLDQDHVALGGAAETGLEEMHQRHADLAQRNAVDFHCHGSSR